VGPMPDGTIPALQRQCLEGLGAWLAANGEAIYGTRPWVTAEGRTADGVDIRYTRKGDALYAILMDAPRPGPLVLPGLKPVSGASIQLLGCEGDLSWRQQADRLIIDVPGDRPPGFAPALRMTPQPRLLAS